VQFTQAPLPGAFVIDLERRTDRRGAFARAFCAREFAERGLSAAFVQANLSENPHRGTLRGMHYQVRPSTEGKLIRCVRGRLYDVVVDMRPESPTRRQWFGVELSAEEGNALYIPPQFAHGFLTLTDDVLAFYQVTDFYTPEVERGVRWDDPAIGVDWPHAPTLVSAKDESWALLERDEEPVR